ncbi:MAG: chorismate synthase [Clostridiales bacterium]|nr:chorismate synthase [Clostridiales bacterium]
MRFEVFGESHGPEIGAVLCNFPAGIAVDFDFIASELARRAGGNSELTTPRRESDNFRIISGVFNDVTTGAPICVIIPNESAHSGDYEETKNKMRPNHADYPAFVKFGGHSDYRGGGHFSGRLTAPITAIGAIAKTFLQTRGIAISSAVLSPSEDEILRAKADGDSIGGCVEVTANGVPAGTGGIDTDSLDGVLAKLFFSIPAVKAVEFGAGVNFANARGSAVNDQFCVSGGQVRTTTNNCGGIIGGITSGMPIVARLTFKPTPSISKPQHTVSMPDMRETTIEIRGRHDPCIVPRAAVVAEAMLALGLGGALS